MCNRLFPVSLNLLHTPVVATFCLLAAVVQVDSLTAKLAKSDSQLQQAVKTTLEQVRFQCKD